MSRQRVLVIATSHDHMGDTGHRTGVWLEELATPYYALLDGGAEVTLASIKGGEIPFDPRSLPSQAETESGEKPRGQQDIPESVARFLADEEAMQAARHSPSIVDIDTSVFDAVFLPGGHGPMWDAASDPTLARIVSAMFDAGKIIGAVCHGPAGLVSAKREDGKPLVDGRRVSCFTDSEEESVGLTKAVPFLLEDRLKQLGGRFERGPDFKAFAVKDGNLITGQNPQSSELVARYVLEALEPVT
ncbi:type 1 glutamine amidotransferase domain-containing protein [Microvirga puerhi]|uniref:Type 1 glutamine amidotransferase domain-containing protein n=1 Tax=Microvirga puerhi TaxID=2876078 RepID=A0ABS7VPD4_9HYPH|nr:type 1 glutamine amidotransferase domain-containing protein [Microvirga puerhi]MBZ6076808.1 type 1 glutamine amidotransferase domain-containing protein [Microvirga puerhi]